jgi:hypothetical protein
MSAIVMTRSSRWPTHHDGQIRIVVLLLNQLGVDVDSRKPTAISRVTGMHAQLNNAFEDPSTTLQTHL